MAKKRKNNKIKKQIKDAFILTLITCVMLYILYKIISLIASPTETFILKESTISVSESKVAYVIRQEETIESTKIEGKIIPIKNEGEKVASGNPIFKYYNVNEEDINKQIDELNKQIQEAMLGQKDLFPGDIKSIENQIEDEIEKLKNENNMQYIKEYKNNISDYIVKKAKIAGSLSSAGKYINELITKRNELEKNLNNGAEYVYAKTSGMISYRTDGLEDTFSINNLDNLTHGYLESLNLTTGQIISKNASKAKVINNFECYIAVGMNSEEAKKAKVGDKIQLRLSNQTEVNAKVYKINDEGNEKLVFFKITDGVEELINYRKISIDVIWWQYKGLIVPKTSILYENGKSYVFIKKNNDFNKILVKIEKENNNYCVIDNYKTEELIELGYTTEEINKLKTVKLFDEVMVDAVVE